MGIMTLSTGHHCKDWEKYICKQIFKNSKLDPNAKFPGQPASTLPVTLWVACAQIAPYSGWFVLPFACVPRTCSSLDNGALFCLMGTTFPIRLSNELSVKSLPLRLNQSAVLPVSFRLSWVIHMMIGAYLLWLERWSSFPVTLIPSFLPSQSGSPTSQCQCEPLLNSFSLCWTKYNPTAYNQGTLTEHVPMEIGFVSIPVSKQV